MGTKGCSRRQLIFLSFNRVAEEVEVFQAATGFPMGEGR
jgi:hypothetical protein